MRVDRTSGAVAAARGSMSLPPSRNQSSTTLSGSYIGSVMGQVHRRNSLFLGATSLEPAPHIEKKLDRVRKMSEARQRQELAGPRPRATQIPTEVGDITLDFVRLVANQYLLKHDRPLLQKTDPVHDLSITDCKAGVGDYSSTVKIDFVAESSAESSGPQHFCFIAKLLPADDVGRIYVFEANLLEKEIEMYFEVLPSLRAYMREHARGDEDYGQLIGEAIPECVYASHNTDGAGVLVFRSDVARGFHHATDPDGLSLDELLLAAATTARVHAAGRGLIHKHGLAAVRGRYPYLSRGMYSSGVFLREVEELLKTYDRLLDAVEDRESALEVREVYGRLRSNGGEPLLDGLRRQGPATLTTITHGELWEKNLLFRSSDERCILLDWKNSKLASASLDLAFLVFSSASARTIAAGLPAVLHRYHDTFCSLLSRLEPDCALPSYDEVRRDFAASVRVALLQAVCMFVREMEYLERLATKDDGSVDDDVAGRLRAYEHRVLELLTIIEVEARRRGGGRRRRGKSDGDDEDSEVVEEPVDDDDSGDGWDYVFTVRLAHDDWEDSEFAADSSVKRKPLMRLDSTTGFTLGDDESGDF